MLRLFLLRHAKAAQPADGGADIDRPLEPRGREAALAMAAYMTERGYGAARVLCSAALRTRETLGLMLPHIAGECEIRLSQRLYGADAPGYLEAIREFGLAESGLMLIGHNPAIAELAAVLAPVGDAEALVAIREKYPTAGLALIGFDHPRWADIGPGSGRLIAFHTPRSIAPRP